MLRRASANSSASSFESAAAAALQDLGITPTVVDCDVTDRRAVTDLLGTANNLGTVVSVIHTAGVSPSMGAADYVMRTNAIGTVNVNEEFFAVAGEGAVIVNVASMAAHMLPAGISGVSYTLELQACAPFRIDESALRAVLGSRTQDLPEARLVRE